jgi:Pentapeptide repeats (9 copies)
MPSDPAGYLVGRASVAFPVDGDPITDIMIAAQRLDGSVLTGRRFNHCTFANVSFKETQLTDSEFNDCAFVNCYFRKARITNCRFVGSRFYGCEFPRIALQSCDFMYATFFACAVPFGEMEHNLPSEPNLREELAAGMALAAEERGWTAQAKEYRLAAIGAREEHLVAAVSSKSTWYKEHYSSWRRVGACVQFVGSKLNGFLWGYGERWGILLRNLFLLTILVFPALLWLVRKDLIPSGRNPATVKDVLWLSLSAIVPVNVASPVAVSSTTAQMILTSEAFCGVVIGGLFVTLLLRSVLNR